MARPKRDGLLYFPLDVDFFYGDRKIKSLRARYGGDGLMFYLYLLTEIYRNGYYTDWDNDSIDNAVCDLNLTEGFIKQVMEYLVSRSLLTKVSILAGSVTVITSPEIQKQWQEAVKSMRRDFYVNSEIWLLKNEETASFIKFTQNTDKSDKNTDKSGKNKGKSGKNGTNEKKRNEMKGNENKEADALLYFPSENLNRTFCDFVEYRKKIKSPMTGRAVELAVRRLKNLAADDNERIEIINQSILSGWKGLFPLKGVVRNGGYKQNDKSGSEPTLGDVY